MIIDDIKRDDREGFALALAQHSISPRGRLPPWAQGGQRSCMLAPALRAQAACVPTFAQEASRRTVLGGLSIGGLGPQSKHAFDQRSKARRASLLCPLAHCARGRNGFSRELGQSLPRALGGVPLGDHNLFQGPQLMFQDATLLLGPGIRGPRLLGGGPAPPDSGP